MKNTNFIYKYLDDAQNDLEYAVSNPAEFAQVNALTSIAASLLAIAALLSRMDERAEIEIEREDMLRDR